jgi:hypothetical protein
VTNLCRDEVTAVLKDKIETVWGGSFNVNGLGGVITCGVTGFKAGLSHAPVCSVSAAAAVDMPAATCTCTLALLLSYAMLLAV